MEFARMSRIVSFLVLVGIIGVCGALFFRVMAGFLLPLFFATLLVVIFRPVHRWTLVKCKQRENVAAGLTTAAILLMVLIPLAWVLSLAIMEGYQLVTLGSSARDQVTKRLETLRAQFGLDIVHGPLLTRIETTFDDLSQAGQRPQDASNAGAARARAVKQLDQLRVDVALLAAEQSVCHGLKDAARMNAELGEDSPRAGSIEVLENRRKALDKQIASDGTIASDRQLRQILDEMLALNDRIRELNRRLATDLGQAPKPEPDNRAVAGAPNPSTESVVGTLRDLQERLEPENNDARIVVGDDEYQSMLAKAELAYRGLRQQWLGGWLIAWLVELANPSDAEIRRWESGAITYFKGSVVSVTGATAARLGAGLLGLAIMTLAMFYFFRDGPSMVAAIMRLSPLEDRYERELAGQFDKISRAVVLATLLSAVAQGLLAGIGYFFANVGALFLLTMLTMFFAMVPFLGSAAIWVPTCLWLAFVEERALAAVILAAYGVGVVSMADNIIKPVILHGQTRLHPLLALLSVLGGVQALGPIGVLVGPMVVSFLQALLNMLHSELSSMDESSGKAAGVA